MDLCLQALENTQGFWVSAFLFECHKCTSEGASHHATAKWQPAMALPLLTQDTQAWAWARIQPVLKVCWECFIHLGFFKKKNQTVFVCTQKAKNLVRENYKAKYSKVRKIRFPTYLMSECVCACTCACVCVWYHHLLFFSHMTRIKNLFLAVTAGLLLPPAYRKVLP